MFAGVDIVSMDRRGHERLADPMTVDGNAHTHRQCEAVRCDGSSRKYPHMLDTTIVITEDQAQAPVHGCNPAPERLLVTRRLDRSTRSLRNRGLTEGTIADA